jgi:hypothetical protein
MVDGVRAKSCGHRRIRRLSTDRDEQQDQGDREQSQQERHPQSQLARLVVFVVW